ncbi:MAG: CpaF family protein [Enterocloster sp.]
MEEMIGSKGRQDREGIRSQLRTQVMEELQEKHHMEDEELQERIDSAIRQKSRQIYLPLKERLWLRGSLFDSFRRLDILQELLDDREVTEIMVNGAGKIFIERKGKMELWGRHFEKPEQLEDIIQQVVGRINRTVNVSSPIVDARLEDGSRVHVVLPPVALDGPVVTIRKFPEPMTMEKLLNFGALTEEAADFLRRLVEERFNLFISGGTNSGKTTFLNALSAFIPQEERVITIEDSAELQISQVPNLVRLETRNANTEGEGEITMSQLIRASLRMNPSRIIVGEVRGPEALDMLQAMNTGHPGSLSTGHANSAEDMISRLETMVLMAADLPLDAIRSQITSALDVMIHLGRLRDGTRKVLSVMKIGGYRNGTVEMEPLYEYDSSRGQLIPTGQTELYEDAGYAGNCTGRKTANRRKSCGSVE